MEMMTQKDYGSILASLKDKIRQAKAKAILTVNTQLLVLYHEIGSVIADQEKSDGWGAKTVEKLASDLRLEFPDMKGISPRNLRYMRDFAKAYPGWQIWQQGVAKLNESDNQLVAFLQQAVAKLPWGHHTVILNKLKTDEERAFYILKCVENNWSRNILATQIESNLFARHGKVIANFDQTLSAPQSDLARESFKNPYVFDFLSITEQVHEVELEKALIAHIKKFTLELGKGFAYVGNQYHLEVAGNDYFLDLLFFNVHLNCFVVFELKVGEFKPEFAGKLNFYINTVDEKIKGANHQPTIGILLCKTPDKTVVEYALRGMTNPLGVSDYELSKALPKKLSSDLPTVEELESEIDKEYEELKSPSEKKWEALKQKLASLNKPKVQVPVTIELLRQLVDQSLKPLFEKLLERMAVFQSEFTSYEYFWCGPNNITDFVQASNTWKDEGYLKANKDLYFNYKLNGLRTVGTDTFDVMMQLHCQLHNPYWYGFYLMNRNNNQVFFRKLYTEQLTNEEVNMICETIYSEVVDDIAHRLEYIEKDKRINK